MIFASDVETIKIELHQPCQFEVFRRDDKSNRMFFCRSSLNRSKLDLGPGFSRVLLKAAEVMIRKQSPHLKYIFQYQSHYWNQMGKTLVRLILPGF